MPVISRFYGLVIKMYYQQREHNPPHFHVLYGEYMGAIDIRTLQMFEGDLPARALRMAQTWAEDKKDALLDIWEYQRFVELPPLE